MCCVAFNLIVNKDRTHTHTHREKEVCVCVEKLGRKEGIEGKKKKKKEKNGSLANGRSMPTE